MPGKVIGKTVPFGYRGNVSRTPDCVISSFTNVGEANIEFGEPVVFDATLNGVRKIKTTDTAGVVGIAVRHIGQPYSDDAQGYYYKPGDVVDVLVRGSICVELPTTTGIAARGKVYVSKASDSLGTILAASGTNAVEVPNTIFTNGKFDANKIVEVTILERSI